MKKTIKNFKTLNNDFKGAQLNTLVMTLYNNIYEYDIFVSTTSNPQFIKITVFDFVNENGFQFETTTPFNHLKEEVIKYISICINANDLKILDF